jgi:hypothetical protein
MTTQRCDDPLNPGSLPRSVWKMVPLTSPPRTATAILMAPVASSAS